MPIFFLFSDHTFSGANRALPGTGRENANATAIPDVAAGPGHKKLS